MSLINKLVLPIILSASLLQSCNAPPNNYSYHQQFYYERDEKDFWKKVCTRIKIEKMMLDDFIKNTPREENSIIREFEYYKKATSK